MPYPHQSVLPALIALSGYAAALGAPELAVGQAPRGPIVTGDLGRRLDAYLTRAEAFGFSGTVLVASHSKIVLRKGYGEADREQQRQMTTESVFDIGSITKQFTAAAILKLEEQGRLLVTDSIGRFFDAVPLDKAGITLHHLLTHTAGLPEYSGDDYDLVSRDSVVRLALAAPLASPPGAVYRYSNVGYSLLGAVVEISSGRSYETFLQEALLGPAGVRETGYRLGTWAPGRIAAAYWGTERWGTPLERPWAPDGPSWNLRANGGILSTVDDLYRWHLALEAGRVLGKPSRQKLFAPHTRTDEEGRSHYGYGWSVTRTDRGTMLISHGGSNGYFSAEFRRYVDEGVVLIFLTNEAVNRRLVARLDRLIFGGAVASPPAPILAPPGERLARYAGTYRLASGVEFTVVARRGGLEVPAADPEVGMAFMTSPELGAAAEARLAGVDAVTASVVSAMAQGDFGPFRAHFLALASNVDVEGEIAVWRRRFQIWSEESGAFRGSTVLATTPGRSPQGATLGTWVAVRFTRGVRLIRFVQLAEGPRRGFYLIPASSTNLPARHVFAPSGDDAFVTFDFTSERSTTIQFRTDAAGRVTALVIQSPQGGLVARRVG
jgi:CubicO group peptidase (beta-lactamase class C family)